MSLRYSVAIDLGASGGKMAAGSLIDEQVKVLETYDFANSPVLVNGNLYWDVFGLYKSILGGLKQFVENHGAPQSIGIDTWGATYGLIDQVGRLAEPVFHYRDKRTENCLDALYGVVSKRDLYAMTGCQCNRTYTLPHLFAAKSSGDPVLSHATDLLFLPDLLSYFLTGVKSTEKTIAGTSALFDRSQTDWCHELIERFDFPKQLFSALCDPGTVKGPLLSEVKAQIGLNEYEHDIQVVATVSHDTASAVAAIPDFDEDSLYISIGTILNVGTLSDTCVTSEEAFRAGLKNTGGFDHSMIVYQDFSAFWFINELRKAWRDENKNYTFAEIDQMAADRLNEVPPLDLESPGLNHGTGNMKEKMNASLIQSNQVCLVHDADYVKCIYEGIVEKISRSRRLFEQTLSRQFSKVFVISGGSRNTVLCQMIADRIDLPVYIGLPYASLIGNLLVQFYANGDLSSAQQMRQISANSFEMKLNHH